MADGSSIPSEQPATDVRAQLRAVMDTDKRLTQSSVARECGVSPSALNQWLKATYAGDNDKLEAAVVRWLDTLQAARASNESMPASPDWIPTPTSDRIIAGLRYAQLAGDIVICYGGAGVGKTKSIAHYRNAAPNVWVATMTPASASVVTALEEICDALGIRNVGGGAAKLHREVVKKVANTHGLLVIDEAQHLSVAALDQIRSIHDATGLGIALVGNERIYATLTGGNRAPYLDRLYSRIGKRVRVARSTEGDIAAVLTAWGIDEKACRAQLVDIASKPGAIRGLTKVLRLASMYAHAENRRVCCDDVRAAWRELGGVE